MTKFDELEEIDKKILIREKELEFLRKVSNHNSKPLEHQLKDIDKKYRVSLWKNYGINLIIIIILFLIIIILLSLGDFLSNIKIPVQISYK